MNDDPTLSLLPSAKNGDTGTLSDLLYAIGQQRGSFRNFTEESLLEEVNGDIEIKDQEVIDDSPAPIARTATHVRDEVLNLIGQGLNEAALALDFTSLLLSGTRPAATQSISPALKEAVPVGALAFEVVSQEQVETSEDTSLALGYRNAAVTRIVDQLRASQKNAEEDKSGEDVYWSEVNQLTQEGWLVVRNSNVLSVRFSAGAGGLSQLAKDHKGHLKIAAEKAVGQYLQFELLDDGVSVARYSSASHQSSARTDIDANLLSLRETAVVRNIFASLVREIRKTPELANTSEQTLTIKFDSIKQIRVSIIEDTELDVQMTDSAVSYSVIRIWADMVYLLYALGSQQILSTLLVTYKHGSRIALVRGHFQTLVNNLTRYTWPSLSLPSVEELHDAMTYTITLQFLGMLTKLVMSSSVDKPTSCEYSLSFSSSSKVTTTKHWSDVVKFMSYTLYDHSATYLVNFSNGALKRCSETRFKSVSENRIQYQFEQNGTVHIGKIVADKLSDNVNPINRSIMEVIYELLQ